MKKRKIKQQTRRVTGASVQLPELVSRFDYVLGQLHVLMRDVEQYRWDAGLSIMVNNGQINVRGLGGVGSAEHIAVLLALAMKSLPPHDQNKLPGVLTEMMQHSQRVQKESGSWMGFAKNTPDLS